MENLLEAIEAKLIHHAGSAWEKYKKFSYAQRVEIAALGTAFVCDGNGNATHGIWHNLTGRTALLGRVVLLSTSATPQSAILTGYAYLFIGETPHPGNIVDFTPNAPGEQSIPQIFEYGSRNNPRIHGNEKLSIQCIGLPANTPVTAFGYAELLPNADGRIT